MSFSMNFLDFLKYLYNVVFQPKRNEAVDVTLVRRFQTLPGCVGELYVNGRQIGMSCDAFNGYIEIIKQPLWIGFEQGHRVLKNDSYILTSGEFTSSVPFNTAYVGSVDPNDNQEILGRLIEAVSPYKAIRLSVVNRFWSFLEN